MTIYWSLRNVPELAPLARADRNRVHEACLRRHIFGATATRRTVFVFLLLMIAFPTAVVALATWSVQAFGGTTPTWLIALILTGAAMLGHFVFSRLAVAQLRQFYSDFIQKEL